APLDAAVVSVVSCSPWSEAVSPLPPPPPPVDTPAADASARSSCAACLPPTRVPHAAVSAISATTATIFRTMTFPQLVPGRIRCVAGETLPVPPRIPDGGLQGEWLDRGEDLRGVLLPAGAGDVDVELDLVAVGIGDVEAVGHG